MTDIVEELRQASLSQSDYRWEAADEIERLRAALRDLLRLVEDDIEEDDSPPYLIDQVCDRARAALEVKND